ncbi:hypothetical protein EVAR_30312_1 [Eumeta japonica]|uniref:Neuromodulin n=1 Tax=Eumeta variegata TaxID=151549 RepID=A0A4C1W8B0_EUMVA|nr:hypothetical protein EVAR_30312_1 [Eumeta japonica]
MTHCRVPSEPSARARARNERSLFHSIGRWSEQKRDSGRTQPTNEKSNEDADKPTEEQAATKIQAAFRGHKTRKTMSMKAQNKAQSKQESEPSKAELEAEFRADDKALSIDVKCEGIRCTSTREEPPVSFRQTESESTLDPESESKETTSES